MFCPILTTTLPFNFTGELASQNLVLQNMNQYHLIYDDSCPICLFSIERIAKLDKLGLVNRVPLSTALKSRKPGMLANDQLVKEMHLITPEGKIYRGAEAVGVLATLFPQSRLFGEIVLLPGIRTLARLVYAQVARHRIRLSRIVPLN